MMFLFGIEFAFNKDKVKLKLKERFRNMTHLNAEITKSSKFEISSIIVIACLLAVLFVGFII
jgi:hypothetical protein